MIADFGAKRYILAAAGVLLIARSLYRAMTTELSENGATAFYGFAHATGQDKTAPDAAI